MKARIGIRREDKNEWEKRVPLVPADIQELVQEKQVDFIVQPSPIRIFNDASFSEAGASVNEDLSHADVIFAVKEIPVSLLEQGKTYIFFSHTIKGQEYNMGMLRRLMELKCNLIDYEKMSDQNNARLITFSFFAGVAGCIETLYAFAQKKELQGVTTPFLGLRQAYQYDSMEQAKDAMEKIGKEISQNGVPDSLHPLTIGITGYGNVARGVNEMLDLLPIKDITPEQLLQGELTKTLDNAFVYRIVFKEQDLVAPKQGTFTLQDYYQRPENYSSIFDRYLPQPQVLLNCVYWTEDYPRFITRDTLQSAGIDGAGKTLQVIGDISCDIEGAIEITKAATKPDNACYTYFAKEDTFTDGISGTGVTVMAIDNLPCEFSRESSASFSKELKNYVDGIASADFSMEFEDLDLPEEVKKALILHNGNLTPGYRYMAEFL